MAQKRMLDKKISISEKVANLSLKAQLLFTWMIPHADDLGLLSSSPRTIKAMVVPMWDDEVEDIGNHLEDIRKQGLIEAVFFRNTKYFHIKNFFDNQTLKKDRNPQSIIQIENIKDDPSASWEKAEKLLQQIILESHGNQVEDIGNHLDAEEKIREDKRTEDNRSEEKALATTPLKDTSLSEQNTTLKKNLYTNIEDLTEEDFQEISKKYDVPVPFVLSKFDDIVIWAGQPNNATKIKGRNWRLTLMKWVKDDAVKIRKEANGKSKIDIIS